VVVSAYSVRDAAELDAILRRSSEGTRFTAAIRLAESGLSGRGLCLITLPQGLIWYSDYIGDVDELPTSIVAVAIYSVGRRITTVDTQVTLDVLVSLAAPTDIAAVIERADLNRTQQAAAIEAMEHGGAMPRVTSQRVWAALLDVADQDRDALEALHSRLNGAVREVGAVGNVLTQERDAIYLAGEIFGDPQAVRPRLNVMNDDSAAPFLGRMRGAVRQLEDDVISADARNFLDWAVEETVATAALQFTSGDRRLTVVNANKGPIERLSGADLLYYVHRTNSFVFVQYKMLTLDSGQWIYRPDPQFDAERARMGDIQSAHDGDVVDHSVAADYRFASAVTYFKFCKRNSTVFDSDDSRLMPGYYVPDAFLDPYLATYTGSRGARVIQAETLGERSLHGSTFARLVAAGLIGTRGATSAEISRVLEGSLAGNRSVVFAFDHTA
jgi:hypothetical protein